MHYTLAGKHIVHQFIAGETIVVNLQTGSYHSLAGGASVIWEALVKGAEEKQMCEHFARYYSSSEEELAEFTKACISQYLTDGLIITADGTADGTANLDNLLDATSDKPAFPRPQIQSFTDMQDALMLDPIHDFDEAGWPNVPAAPAATH